MDAKNLVKCQARLSSQIPFLGGWLRRRAARALLADGSPPALAVLANAASARDSLRGPLQTHLRALTAPSQRAAVCETWLLTRLPFLADIVRAWNEVPTAPGKVALLCALKLGRLDRVANCPPEELAALLLAVSDPDPEIAERARLVVGRLQNPATRDRLCWLFLHTEQERLGSIAVQAGYQPLQPVQRALFFFLTDQWDAYDTLDFDRSLLRIAYQTADPVLRRRIIAKVREQGRVDLIAIFAPGNAHLRFSATEWQTTLDVLSSSRADRQLWETALSAPPVWSARAVRRLAEMNWTPAEHERELYRKLVETSPAWEKASAELSVFCRAALEDNPFAVTSLAFDRSETLLACGTRTDALFVWSVPDGKLVRKFWSKGPTKALLFAPDGQHFVTGGNLGQVEVWALDHKEPERLSAHHAGVNCLAFDARGQSLASGGWDGSINLWDFARRKFMFKLDRHHGGIMCLAFAPEQDLLASGGMDRTLRLWDTMTGKELHRLTYHSGVVTSLAFREDGRMLASGSPGELLLWDVALKRSVAPYPPDAGDWIAYPSFEPDRLCISSCRQRRRVRLPPTPDTPMRAARGRGKIVRVWNVADGKALRSLRGHHCSVTCLSPGASLLASGDKNGVVRLWDLHSRLDKLRLQPLSRMKLADWTWVHEQLGRETFREDEEQKLRYLDALLAWRWRHEIQIEEGDRPLQVDAYDIEIE